MTWRRGPVPASSAGLSSPVTTRKAPPMPSTTTSATRTITGSAGGPARPTRLSAGAAGGSAAPRGSPGVVAGVAAPRPSPPDRWRSRRAARARSRADTCSVAPCRPRVDEVKAGPADAEPLRFGAATPPGVPAPVDSGAALASGTVVAPKIAHHGRSPVASAPWPVPPAASPRPASCSASAPRDVPLTGAPGGSPGPTPCGGCRWRRCGAAGRWPACRCARYRPRGRSPGACRPRVRAGRTPPRPRRRGGRARAAARGSGRRAGPSPSSRPTMPLRPLMPGASLSSPSALPDRPFMGGPNRSSRAPFMGGPNRSSRGSPLRPAAAPYGSSSGAWPSGPLARGRSLRRPG